MAVNQGQHVGGGENLWPSDIGGESVHGDEDSIDKYLDVPALTPLRFTKGVGRGVGEALLRPGVEGNLEGRSCRQTRDVAGHDGIEGMVCVVVVSGGPVRRPVKHSPLVISLLARAASCTMQHAVLNSLTGI